MDGASVALTLGTSGAIRLLEEGGTATVPRGLWCYRLDARRTLVGGAISNGGSVYAWLRDTLDLPPPDALEAELAARPPDAHGLTVLPYLSGERNPDWPLDARGIIAGLTAGTTAVAIAQACLEAVAYRLALIHERLSVHAPSIERVVASGGAVAASRYWRRLLADVLGEPLVVSTAAEASARGAALLALESTGALADLSDAPRPWGPEVRPGAERHAVYRRALERYRALDRHIADWGAAEQRP